jgi:hypothetical protein
MRLAPMTLPLLLGLCACAQRDPPAGAPAQDQDASRPAPVADAPPAAPPPAATPAAQEIPARFRGHYAADAAACARQGEESELHIEARRVAFHESAGEVVAARPDGDAIAIDLRMSSEGETWQRTYGFRLEADDTALVDAEGGMRRIRCPAG